MKADPTAGNCFQRAVDLLQPFMSAERRDTWLTRAFYFDHRDLYDGIDQQGAPADFTVHCVHRLLEAGCRGGRHTLSWLLEVVWTGCGDERQPEFTALIDELDRSCAPASAQAATPVPAVPVATKPDRPAVFISYARADATLVNRLADDLRAAGHACWIDTSDIPGGEVWLEAIAAGIESAYAFVTLVTPAANATTTCAWNICTRTSAANTSFLCWGQVVNCPGISPTDRRLHCGRIMSPACSGCCPRYPRHRSPKKRLLENQHKLSVEDQRKLRVVVTCWELDYTGTLNLDLDTLTIRPLDPLRIREFVITYLTTAIDPADSDPVDREATGAARGEDLFWKLAGGDEVRQVWQVWQAAGADLTLLFHRAGDSPG